MNNYKNHKFTPIFKASVNTNALAFDTSKLISLDEFESSLNSGREIKHGNGIYLSDILEKKTTNRHSSLSFDPSKVLSLDEFESSLNGGGMIKHGNGIYLDD